MQTAYWAVILSFQVAASIAFLIARYFARERILKLVEGNKKFLAIDKAIGENGFKVVTLLRLSPLLPFSLGNYLYGLTSVKFVPYVLGRSASSFSLSLASLMLSKVLHFSAIECIHDSCGFEESLSSSLTMLTWKRHYISQYWKFL